MDPHQKISFVCFFFFKKAPWNPSTGDNPTSVSPVEIRSTSVGYYWKTPFVAVLLNSPQIQFAQSTASLCASFMCCHKGSVGLQTVPGQHQLCRACCGGGWCPLSLPWDSGAPEMPPAAMPVLLLWNERPPEASSWVWLTCPVSVVESSSSITCWGTVWDDVQGWWLCRKSHSRWFILVTPWSQHHELSCQPTKELWCLAI